jgi:protein-tyrosine phosphatase
MTAGSGMPASPDAVATVKDWGVDLDEHRSRRVTLEMINEADVIYCMTDSHREALLSIAPHAAGRIHRLDPDRDVGDPIGMGPQAYEAAARQIRTSLESRLKEHDL